MENSINVLLGLTKINGYINPIYTTGSLVRWYEIIAVSSAVFAISQFMESTKLRAYIFKLGNLSKDVFQLMILSILTVMFANILPLFKFDPNFVVPLLDYPAFWEVFSLITFTISIILFLIFSLFPFKFIPRINHKNCERFYWRIYNLILNDSSDESLAAVATIVYMNLDTICEYASKYDSFWDVQGSNFKNPFERSHVPLSHQGLVLNSMQLIDTVLSTGEFCTYLSKNNIGFVLKIIDVSRNFSSSCGNVFFDSLCKELFSNPQSHLAKELEYRGQGLEKPVFNALFKSLDLVDAYRLLDPLFFWNKRNIKPDVVDKYIEALNISLRQFFQIHSGYNEAGPGGFSLYSALDRLPWGLKSVLPKLNRYKEAESYDTPTYDIVKSIMGFYSSSNLKKILSIIVVERIRPQPSALIKRLPLRTKILIKWREFLNYVTSFKQKKTLNVPVPTVFPNETVIRDHSVLAGICQSIYELLDSFSILEDDDYVRFLTNDLFWLLFPWEGMDEKVTKIEDKLLEIIKSHVEDGKKIKNVPLIRILVNIYGCQFSNMKIEKTKIGKYIEEEFKSNFAEQILNDKYQSDKHR